MILAINEEGDSDTLGAVYGSIAGAYYGYNNIPNRWKNDLRKKELIDDICNKYVIFLDKN